MKTDYEKWMKKAIEEARAAAKNGNAPVAAIIVQRDSVVSIGHNTKTSENSGFAHAELNALLAYKHLLSRRPEGCILYSTLEPCAMCLGAITFSGIRKVVYGAPDSQGGAVTMFKEHPTYRIWMPEIIAGILQSQCEELKDLPTF